MTGKPVAGEVFRYPFLWTRQHHAGETAGRKPRPVCLAVTAATANGDTLLFIVPITTQPPLAGRLAVQVPPIEARRAGLDTVTPCWVMLDEINTDVFERSYVFEDRTPLGSFGAMFANRIKSNLLAAARAGDVGIVNRRE